MTLCAKNMTFSENLNIESSYDQIILLSVVFTKETKAGT